MLTFFIKRPRFAMVIALVITLLGAIALRIIPVEQYPQITPPVVNVSASWPGASSADVAEAIATPLETQLNGVDHMLYMESTSSDEGTYSLNITFAAGTDPDLAAIDVQNRVAQAVAQLPTEAQQNGVQVRKRATNLMMGVSLYSPNNTHTPLFVSNYASTQVREALSRLSGVGQVQMFGARDYSMRIWLRPDRMNALNVTSDDVAQALREQNVQGAAGQVGTPPVFNGQQQTLTINGLGRLNQADDFANIIIRTGEMGQLVRLKDVATIELGSRSYSSGAQLNGHDSAYLGIYPTPSANALRVADAVRAELERLSTRFPDDLVYEVKFDTTSFVAATIKEIGVSLALTMLAVVVVVSLFLQSWRATLIVALAIPVSLVGTFAVLYALGYSANTLSLFAIILALTMVVDDAIVVVEAVKNHISNGEKPLPATITAMREVSGPIVSTALVISCVFVPTLLLPGVSGKLFEQFAVTIGMSIIISAFCALSLSPALSSRLLKGGNSDTIWLLGPFFNMFNKGFNKARDWYVNACSWLIRRMWLSILLLAAMTALLFPMARLIPSGFLPNEDQGYLFGGAELPDNTSLNVTEKTSAQIERIIREDPGVEVVTTVNGFNLISSVQSSSNSFFFISLKPWSERKGPDMTADAIAARLKSKLNASISSGMAYVVPPPPLPGVGTSGDVTFLLEDRQGIGEEFLASNTSKFIEAAGKRPEIAGISNFMSPSNLQYNLNVNTEQATLQNMNVDEIYATIQAYMGSTFLNNFNIYGQEWQVYMQADAPYRDSIDKLSMFYVRNNNGDPVPLDSVINVTHGWAPEFLIRQNMFNSSQLNITPAEGYSSGQVMNALEEVFAQTMPAGMGYGYSGMSYQEKQAQHGITIGMIFAASAIFVFLILASLYESWSLPVAVFMTVPIAILGAFAALWIFGQQLNIYSEIGLIVLIALAAKNAILIVEFAVLELKQGKDLLTSTLDAARIRLRPILMTSIAFIMGCLPLALATGAGAAARQVVGIGVIGGMITAVFIGVFFIPSFFYLIAKLAKLDKKAALERQEKAS